MKSKFLHPTITSGLVAALLYGLAFWLLTSKVEQPKVRMTVPEGFLVERVAGPPLVNRPIVADFDEQGRLYVADSSGSNDKVEKQLAEKPHRIMRLEDTDGDGTFDKSIVFADRMMFPEGTMWFDGSLYVAAPPSIWKLTDTSGDGVADQREEWFQGKTLTGCANDLHGPYLGLDGWIYWCKGAFARQTHERPGKPPFSTRASHLFRRRPGDSFIEPVMTGGMDNPVDVAFTPTGERILTATFLQHPASGLRDGLIHAIYGGVYGKVHGVIDEHKKTGDLMPVLTHLGPAVPSGLTTYSSRVFGKDYEDNLFAALFNLHKVTRHVLEPKGSTYDIRDSDFLISEDADFHPTDVLEDADGSLIVVDTGAWYKLCCPSSQLAKPDVLGAIYRVKKRGALAEEDPRGLNLRWETLSLPDLAKLLDDERPAVRNRAIHQLARRGNDAVSTLANLLNASSSVEARRNAVWALTRIEGAAARKTVRLALADRDESVRHAASHSAGVWRDAGATDLLIQRLQKDSTAVQRVAAEALGRIGDVRAIPQLLSAAGTPRDRVLEHSLTYALIEIANPAATAAGLNSPLPHTRRAALIALDQMEGGSLKPEKVVPLLNSDDLVLKETAWWIAGHHLDWSSSLAVFFGSRLTAKGLAASEREELEKQLSRLARSADIQTVLAGIVASTAPKESRRAALRAMARASLKELPAAWCHALTRALDEKDAEILRDTASVARAYPATSGDAVKQLANSLLRVAGEASIPAELRLEALAAVPGGLHGVGADVFGFLIAHVHPTQPVAVRSNAALVLSKAMLSQDQLAALADTLRTVGPLELPKLLACYENSSSEELGVKLIAALGQSSGRAVLRADTLKSCVSKFAPSVQKKADELLSLLHTDLGQQKQRLEKLLAGLHNGDVRRGQAVFNSPKTACLSCHTIGYLGGKVGPDLTKIGQIRTERDLLESILFPSASFVRSYESVLVMTRSGETHSGVLRKDAEDEVLLATDARTEVRISRDEIADMRAGTVSVMPSGLDEQLSRQELADLLAFLKQTRRGAR